MGYAEDAAVNNVERIRDNVGTAPSKFLRAAGDRLREDQAALTGTGHVILEEGFPRFVFNKGKVMPGNFTIPSYFITDSNNNIITDPYSGIPEVKNVSRNRSLLVIYQDRSFDAVEKVNSLDLGYLVYVATSGVDHLPAHLRDTGSSDFSAWANYWASESGIPVGATAQAASKLSDVYQEWVNSGKNAMVARSVGFIYNSDQHDISSTRDFDASTGQWSVVLYRKLAATSDRDADLSGLPTGTKYAFGFAIHDVGGGASTHDISMPLTIANEGDVDVKAVAVSSARSVDWNSVPHFDTYYVKREHFAKWTAEWLTGPGTTHSGAAVLETRRCVSCHSNSLIHSSPLP